MCCREALTRWPRSPFISTNACLAKPRSVDQNAGQEERESQSDQRAIDRRTGSIAIAMSRKKVRVPIADESGGPPRVQRRVRAPSLVLRTMSPEVQLPLGTERRRDQERVEAGTGVGQRRPQPARGDSSPWTPTGPASSVSAPLWTRCRDRPPTPAVTSASTCSPAGRSDTSSATLRPAGVPLIQSVRPPASRGHSRHGNHRGVQLPSPLVTATTRPWPDRWNGNQRVAAFGLHGHGRGRVATG